MHVLNIFFTNRITRHRRNDDEMRESKTTEYERTNEQGTAHE